jgi:hypothetical protein
MTSLQPTKVINDLSILKIGNYYYYSTFSTPASNLEFDEKSVRFEESQIQRAGKEVVVK